MQQLMVREVFQPEVGSLLSIIVKLLTFVAFQNRLQTSFNKLPFLLRHILSF